MVSHSKQDDVDGFDRERALSTPQVGELLGLAAVTLAQMRRRGEGPPFFRVNKRHVRYRAGDVLAYRDARIVGKRGAR